jgi:hypothetical protein
MFPYAFYKGKAQGEGWYDHSVSQYGVLAMWAINQMNIEIPGDYWKVTEEAWRIGSAMPRAIQPRRSR